jgi:hypothetical protein
MGLPGSVSWSCSGPLMRHFIYGPYLQRNGLSVVTPYFHPIRAIYRKPAFTGARLRIGRSTVQQVIRAVVLINLAVISSVLAARLDGLAGYITEEQDHHRCISEISIDVPCFSQALCFFNCRTGARKALSPDTRYMYMIAAGYSYKLWFVPGMFLAILSGLRPSLLRCRPYC